MPVCVVKAHLATPVAAMYPLHLDAVLGSAAIGSGHHIQRNSPVSAIIDPDIPIARIHALSARCHLSSAWIWPPDVHRGREHFTKRKDAEDIERRAGPWQHNLGPEKARMKPVPTMEALSVSWIVVGRRAGLIRALRYVEHVGMLRAMGYGVVSKWDVETIDLPPVRVLLDEAGRAARHLPASWAVGATEYGAYEMPYWHPARTSQQRIGVSTVVHNLRPEVWTALAEVR